MPHNIAITPEDIAEVASSFSCDFSDPERTQALSCRTSCDIQACPGSGKTTLLVAKIAVLSSKWQSRDQGICVLSHTNVARREIEKRLATHPTAYRLLNYPHFVGTIQVFVDTYLAIPFLRSKGIDITAISNERFTSRIWHLVPYYRYIESFRQRRKRQAPAIISGLRYEGADLTLGSSGGRIHIGEDTPTFKELLRVKKKISVEGIFRYEDMYAFAERYLQQYPTLPEVISRRFPWVFIDEMQDTSTTQTGLLNRIFDGRSTVQRLGDVNQAIFSDGTDEEGNDFPRPNSLSLSKSKRFGSTIARFASKLTPVQEQQIEGDEREQEQQGTIFLFDKDTIRQVLPGFGVLMLETYKDDLPDRWPVKAVGYLKSDPTTRKEEVFPYNIGDYWSDFKPSATTKSTRPAKFAGFVREARHNLVDAKQWSLTYNTLLEGIVEILRRDDSKTESGLCFTKTRLIENLKMRGERVFLAIQDVLLELGQTLELSQAAWELIVRKLLTVLTPPLADVHNKDTWQFLRWDDSLINEVTNPEQPYRPNKVNVYCHNDGTRLVEINVTTIHAVKGETHLATLVLETYWYRHDLGEFIPFLIGEGSRALFDRKRSFERAKRIFVGMTRPRDVVCLAINKQHLNDSQIAMLSQNGWQIQDLT